MFYANYLFIIYLKTKIPKNIKDEKHKECINEEPFVIKNTKPKIQTHVKSTTNSKNNITTALKKLMNLYYNFI